MFVLLFSGRACSNVSSIGNGLHLCLSRSLEVRHSRRTKYLVRPRASYFASRAGNKTSNGNGTFFFSPRPAKNFMPLADTETHAGDHCARRDAENSLSVCGRNTLLSNNHIQPQRIFAFSVRVIISSDNSFSSSFFQRVFRVTTRVVSARFLHFPLLLIVTSLRTI